MTAITISNGEAGSSVRTKLNNTGLERYLPFFGDKSVLWSRPGLDISGDGATHFNAWLNQSASINCVGVGNIFYSGLTAVGAPVVYGSDYVPADTITLTGGTVLTLDYTQVVTATINAAGSGGTPGHVQLIGTTGHSTSSLVLLNGTIAGDGTLASIDSIANAGVYDVNPTLLSAEPMSDNSGSGIIGVTVSLTMGAAGAHVTTEGTVTSNPVSQTGTSGAGSGAKWDLFFTARNAVATDNAGGAPLVIEADIGGTVGSSYVGAGTGATFLLKDAPATPYTITQGLAAPATTEMAVYPFIFYDSTSKTAWSLQWYTPAGADVLRGGELILTRWTDMSTNVAADQLTILGSIQGQSYFQWFRVENDGTDLIFSLSFENIRYQEFFRIPLSTLGMTIDKVGYGILRDFNGGVTIGNNSAVVLWNWVES